MDRFPSSEQPFLRPGDQLQEVPGVGRLSPLTSQRIRTELRIVSVPQVVEQLGRMTSRGPFYLVTDS